MTKSLYLSDMSKRKSPITVTSRSRSRSSPRSPPRESWRVARSRERVSQERRSQERRSQERRDRESRDRQHDNRGRSRSRNNNRHRSRSRDKTKLKFTQEQFDTQRVELEKGFKTKKEHSRSRFEEAIATALAIERGERSTEVLSLKAKITALEAKLAAQPPEAPAQAERLLNGHPLVGR